MKLPSLLTQFLYKNKKLNLPGIGQFIMDPSVVIPEEHSKDIQGQTLGITFKASNNPQADPDLIDFIRVHTGKIKPLATADLESYITLGNELLNIGKPFYLEGIGALTKTQDGRLEFAPGPLVAAKLDDEGHEKHEKVSKRRHVAEEAMHEKPAEQGGGRKTMLAAAIIAGLLIVGAGGYLFYKKNTASQGQKNIAREETVAPVQDTTRTASLPDSLAAEKTQVQPLAGDSHAYRFIILQTHNKERALKRYNQLLSYDLKINMETKDSSYFKVYFSFPALSKDTLHIKDSLRREYAHDIVIER